MQSGNIRRELPYGFGGSGKIKETKNESLHLHITGRMALLKNNEETILFYRV